MSGAGGKEAREIRDPRPEFGFEWQTRDQLSTRE